MHPVFAHIGNNLVNTRKSRRCNVVREDCEAVHIFLGRTAEEHYGRRAYIDGADSGQIEQRPEALFKFRKQSCRSAAFRKHGIAQRTGDPHVKGAPGSIHLNGESPTIHLKKSTEQLMNESIRSNRPRREAITVSVLRL